MDDVEVTGGVGAGGVEIEAEDVCNVEHQEEEDELVDAAVIAVVVGGLGLSPKNFSFCCKNRSFLLLSFPCNSSMMVSILSSPALYLS